MPEHHVQSLKSTAVASLFRNNILDLSWTKERVRSRSEKSRDMNGDRQAYVFWRVLKRPSWSWLCRAGSSCNPGRRVDAQLSLPSAFNLTRQLPPCLSYVYLRILSCLCHTYKDHIQNMTSILQYDVYNPYTTFKLFMFIFYRCCIFFNILAAGKGWLVLCISSRPVFHLAWRAMRLEHLNFRERRSWEDGGFT